ncbi:MAG: tetratricopeptide repeat protein [Legionellales bacterium]
MQQIDSAIKHYQKSLRINAANVSAHNNLGALLIDRNKYTAAIRHFKRALNLNPLNPEAFYNLGSTFLLMSNPEAALKYFLRLSQIKPEFDVYYNLGVIYRQLHRHRDAIIYFAKALELKPDAIEVNVNLAEIYLDIQDYAQAINHYQVLHAIDPQNKEIDYMLAALSNDENLSLQKAPKEYVTHLFDQYADHFEKHLAALQYQAPQLLYAAVTEIIGFCREKLNILDLGCGTGLAGEKFRVAAKKLIGVDLSQKMLDVAQTKQIYDELLCASMEDVIGEYCDLDLIIAADVLVYVGDLVLIFALCAKALKKHGIFVFTLERTDTHPYLLQKSMRFAHNEKYIENLAQIHGFEVLRHEHVVLRKQRNIPVASVIYVLKTP